METPMHESSLSRSRRAFELLLQFSVPLIAGVVVAVLWANLDEHGYHALVHWSPFGHHSPYSLHFLFNDLFMVLFFGIAAKEITEACLPGGALNPPRKAISPLLGTLGGVLGPIAVYLAWMTVTGDAAARGGWGIPTATDIALAWLVARVVFGKGHPAVSFLLLLAVADDGLGLLIIAVFYPDPAHPVRPELLLLVAAAVGLAFAMRRKGVRSFWPYLAGPGVLSWVGLFFAHLHPALALVPIIPFLPNMGHDEGLFAEEGDGREHHDTLNAFEHFFKKPVEIGLFGFGLFNAGVAFSSIGNATWAVFAALLVGKTLGIFGFAAVGHYLGFKLPTGMTLRSLFTAGMVAGLGLTVALFVAGVAFTDPALQGAAKMGALFSVAVVPLAVLVGRALRVRELGAPPDAGEVGERLAELSGAHAAVPKTAGVVQK